MPAKNPVPAHLYKYRSFDTRTIELIVADQLYFADPGKFNDPLDAKPCITPDLPIDELASLLARLLEKGATDHLQLAARTLKYKGPKITDRIGQLSQRQAQQLINKIAYFASEPDCPKDGHQNMLALHIQRELLRQYDKGVLSFAERFDCPLMWSHYGAQHEGICLGYQIPQEAQRTLYQVQYGGSRVVTTSKILAMLDGDKSAKEEVEATVLLRKAPDWDYEKEWRMIDRQGLRDSHIELTDITFGMRCPETVKHAVARALDGREREVELFEMSENYGTFDLKREPLNIAEFVAAYPRRSLSGYEAFSSNYE